MDNQKPELGMGWYKFLIFFQLPASMILSAVNALNYLSRTHDVCYIVYAIGILLLVGFAFCVHYGLRKYMALAPRFLLIFYGIGIVDAIIQIIISVSFGLSPIDYVSRIIAGTVLLVINSIYFSNRSNMFLQEDTKFKYIGYALFISALAAIVVSSGLVMTEYKKPKSDSKEMNSTSSYSSSTDLTNNDSDFTVNIEKESEDTNRAMTNTETESSTYKEKDSPIVDMTSALTYEPPVISGDSYSSSALNLKFTNPKGYKFEDENVLAENDGITADDYSEKLKMDVAFGKLRTEMISSNKSGGGLVQVKLRFDSKIGVLRKAGKTDEDIMDMFTEDALKQFIDADKIKESWGAKDASYTVIDGDFCVQPSKALDVTMDFGDGKSLNLDEYLFVSGDFLGYIVVVADSKEKCDQIMSCFSTEEQ